MPINTKAIGLSLGPYFKTYEEKDCILYALSVGAGFDELPWIYEKNLQVLPTFGFTAAFGFLDEVCRVVQINQSGVVHGEQSLTLHHPIPPHGTLRTEGKIKDIFDKGKGALILVESETWHDNGHKLFTSVLSLYSRFDGGFGGKSSPPDAPFVVPERTPDFSVADLPAPHQPALYRLSGDFFAIHIDPEFAKQVGFSGPIMHGLCTYGYACRAVLHTLCRGQSQRLQHFSARFSKILYPGQPIATQIWDVGEGHAMFRVINTVSQDVVLDRGTVLYQSP